MHQFKVGDLAIVAKGEHKGVNGTIASIEDVNVFIEGVVVHISQLKAIKSIEEVTLKGSEEYRTATADRLRKRYERDDVKEAEHKRRRTPDQRFVKARHDASKRASGAKEFSLTFVEYIDIINGRCEYCNSDISQEAGSGLDRIDNDKGYILGNVNPCCSNCNRRRGKSMSAEEFKRQNILNGYWKET